MIGQILTICLALNLPLSAGPKDLKQTGSISTFSIVGYDPATGELGIAVASRFFAVGSVVPWAKAGVGAVATQSFANTSFGWRGLSLLEQGASPEETARILLRDDDGRDNRQFGIVSKDGQSMTYTGSKCLPWAGGKSGPNYAVQGNILTGESVVISMEKTFLETRGTLAERLYAALVAGDKEGGDSRGKQSAALAVVREKAGYGGFTDRAIDIRVDDHKEPITELGRLLNFAQVNYLWNEAWTLFEEKKYSEACPIMEHTALLAPENAEVLYDLAVIRLAAGQKAGALSALEKAVHFNSKLKKQAAGDHDLQALSSDPTFIRLIQ